MSAEIDSKNQTRPLSIELTAQSTHGLIRPIDSITNQQDVYDIVHDKFTSPDGSESDQQSLLSSRSKYLNILTVLYQIIIPAIAVMLSFTVTIGIFPSLIVNIASVNQCKDKNRAHNDLFIPIMFLIFNIADFLGRLLAPKFSSYIHKYVLFGMPWLRFLFFPLFLSCNIPNNHSAILFGSDIAPFCLMAVFAFSSGFISSCGMIIGPSLVNLSDATLAGTIMTFFLSFGLTFGACISYIVMN